MRPFDASPTPLIIPPKEETLHDSSIIWLHGLGATKHDFEAPAQMLQMSQLPSTKFILPQAPTRPVTINNGYPCPSWFDITHLESPRIINHDELKSSSEMIIALIEEEIALGIDPQRIFLAGFSQGGSVVLYTAYKAYQKPLGGVVALSTFLEGFDTKESLSPIVTTIPALNIHGTRDPVVLLHYGEEAHNYLKSRDVETEWHTFTMRHEVMIEELRLIENWLVKKLSSS